MASVESKNSPYTAAVPRHVTSDGCQLVLKQDGVAPGQRFRFNLAGCVPIVGTVRWVVADRIGFAFDYPLSRISQDALVHHWRNVHGLELYLV